MLFRQIVALCLLTTVSALIEIRIQTENQTSIPPPNEVACMARYVVHNSDWCSLAYISKQNDTTYDKPASRVFSISDGLPGNSTGTVYLMVAKVDLTVDDLLVNNTCSVIMTLAQSPYCQMKRYDAQDPRCAQVILTGSFITFEKKSEEAEFAKKVLWARHPIMRYWYYIMPTHGWMFGKIDIKHISVVDTFGGRKFPSVTDYYNQTSCLQNGPKKDFDLLTLNVQTMYST